MIKVNLDMPLSTNFWIGIIGSFIIVLATGVAIFFYLKPAPSNVVDPPLSTTLTANVPINEDNQDIDNVVASSSLDSDSLGSAYDDVSNGTNNTNETIIKYNINSTPSQKDAPASGKSKFSQTATFTNTWSPSVSSSVTGNLTVSWTMSVHDGSMPNKQTFQIRLLGNGQLMQSKTFSVDKKDLQSSPNRTIIFTGITIDTNTNTNIQFISPQTSAKKQIRYSNVIGSFETD